MNWPNLKLELLAANEPYAFVGGPFGSKLTSHDYVDDGVPVIRGTNLKNGRFLSMSDFVFVSDSKVREDLSGNLARSGDLIFTQRGTLGQVAIVPDDGISNCYVVSQSQMKLTVDDAKVDKLFLYYYMSSRKAIERIVNFTSSSGVPHINLTVLRNFKVPVPPIETQESIASILSAYDDLIENNRRRIQLLEQAARLLYKEWFVHLRFPGHEHVKIKDGVPEGWERTNVSEIIEFNPEEAPPSRSSIRYVPMNALSTSGMTVDLNVSEMRTKPTSVRYKNGDTLLARITPSLENGKTGFVNYLDEGEMGCGSTEFIVLRGKLVSPYFTYYLARMHDFRETAIKSMTGSSGRQRVQLDCLKDFGVTKPPLLLRGKFDHNCQSTFKQIAGLMSQNQLLGTARDLLLPRLMSGALVSSGR